MDNQRENIALCNWFDMLDREIFQSNKLVSKIRKLILVQPKINSADWL